MILKDTQTVTTENGPRPAGQPDRCFYCDRAVGEQHKEDCVCRKRTVVIRVSFVVLVERPESWTAKDIENHANNSSSCASNLLDEVDVQARRLDGCACNFTTTQYLREATGLDHATFSPVDGVKS